MMLLACAGVAKTMPSHGPHGKTSTCCNSLPACEKSFLTRKEYAICRSPRQIETYSLAMDPTGIKLKLLNSFCEF